MHQKAIAVWRELASRPSGQAEAKLELAGSLPPRAPCSATPAIWPGRWRRTRRRGDWLSGWARPRSSRTRWGPSWASASSDRTIAR